MLKIPQSLLSHSRNIPRDTCTGNRTVVVGNNLIAQLFNIFWNLLLTKFSYFLPSVNSSVGDREIQSHLYSKVWISALLLMLCTNDLDLCYQLSLRPGLCPCDALVGAQWTHQEALWVSEWALWREEFLGCFSLATLLETVRVKPWSPECCRVFFFHFSGRRMCPWKQLVGCRGQANLFC